MKVVVLAAGPWLAVGVVLGVLGPGGDGRLLTTERFVMPEMLLVLLIAAAIPAACAAA